MREGGWYRRRASNPYGVSTRGLQASGPSPPRIHADRILCQGTDNSKVRVEIAFGTRRLSRKLAAPFHLGKCAIIGKLCGPDYHQRAKGNNQHEDVPLELGDGYPLSNPYPKYRSKRQRGDR